MAISLQKGSNISLSKEAPGLSKMFIGLGWDVRVTEGEAFDLDGSAFQFSVPIKGILACYQLIMDMQNYNHHEEHSTWGYLAFAEFYWCRSSELKQSTEYKEFCDRRSNHYDYNPEHIQFYSSLEDKVEREGAIQSRALLYMVYMRFLRQINGSNTPKYNQLQEKLAQLKTEKPELCTYLNQYVFP